MGWFSDIADNWFGIDPPQPPAPPPMPAILSAPPTVQAPALMPTLGSADARTAARAALQGRAGRASTILTTRKKRSAGALPSSGFDSYGSTV